MLQEIHLTLKVTEHLAVTTLCPESIETLYSVQEVLGSATVIRLDPESTGTLDGCYSVPRIYLNSMQ